MTSFFSFDKADRDDQYLCRETASGKQTSQNALNQKRWLNVKNTGKKYLQIQRGMFCHQLSYTSFPISSLQDRFPKNTFLIKQWSQTDENGGGLLVNPHHCWKCGAAPWVWMQLWKCCLRKTTQPVEHNTLHFQECHRWCFCPTWETNYRITPLYVMRMAII